jgi:hypothetical protein
MVSFSVVLIQAGQKDFKDILLCDNIGKIHSN